METATWTLKGRVPCKTRVWRALVAQLIFIRYAYDVGDRAQSKFLMNRRVFAMADVGVPDGLKCDLAGNVYAACGDGLSVWSPGGVLLGKVLVPGGLANFSFGRKGELFLLNGKKLWILKVADTVKGALVNRDALRYEEVE
jgi:gluconolactonase